MSAEIYEGSALLPTQAAIFAALSGDAALTTLLGGAGKVYDEVETCAEMPYIRLGECTSVPYRTHTRKGEEVTVTIHVWSQYKGNKEVGEIINRVNAILGDADLPVEGYDVIRCFYEFSTMIKESATDRHGIVRYRIQAQEKLAA